MELKTNYIISKVSDGGRMESLVVVYNLQHLEGDWHFYTVERGYTCKIHKVDYCANCGGTGRVGKFRGNKKVIYSYLVCPECKGEKIPEVDITEQFLESLEKNNVKEN